MRPKRISMQDVADRAGVSKATVSKVLNRKGAVGDAVRRQVLACCENLGYSLNWNIQDMIRLNKNRNSQHIACVVSGIEYGNPVYAPLLDGCAAGGDKHNFFVTLCKITGNEERVFDLPPLLRDKRVDGFLLTGRLNPRIVEVLGRLEIPFIFLGSYSHELVGSGISVETDLDAVFAEVIGELKNRGLRRVLYFDEDHGNYYTRSLFSSFRDAMADKDMPFSADSRFGGGGIYTGSYEYFQNWYAMTKPDFDAIVCMDFRVVQNLSYVLIRELAAEKLGKVLLVTSRSHLDLWLPLPAIYADPMFAEMAMEAIDILVGMIGGSMHKERRKLLLKPNISFRPAQAGAAPG